MRGLDFFQNVTGGAGGFACLIQGSDKTALHDCGMAYCAENAVRRCADALRGRPLDYILLSHTHYDHVGGLPAFRRAFPHAQVLGARHGAAVLEKASVRDFIRRMSLQAALDFDGGRPFDFDEDALRIDRIVEEGEVVDLGDLCFRVMETPGHTNDCLSFYEPRHRFLLAAETMGTRTRRKIAVPACLTSYRDMQRSIRRCVALQPEYLYLSHSRPIQGSGVAEYWTSLEKANEDWRSFILNLHNAGVSEEEIALALRDRYWPDVKAEQPQRAFDVNAVYIIRCMIRSQD
jgi:glyoxylase-like metal-dependent hydrolase (beta-lactamase superfamily II)